MNRSTLVIIVCMLATVGAAMPVAAAEEGNDEGGATSGEPCLDVDATSRPPTVTWSTDCIP